MFTSTRRRCGPRAGGTPANVHAKPSSRALHPLPKFSAKYSGAVHGFSADSGCKSMKGPRSGRGPFTIGLSAEPLLSGFLFDLPSLDHVRSDLGLAIGLVDGDLSWLIGVLGDGLFGTGWLRRRV